MPQDRQSREALGARLRIAAAVAIVLVSTVGFLMLVFTEDLAASGSSLSDLSTSGEFLEPGGGGGTRLGLDRLTYQKAVLSDDEVAALLAYIEEL